MRFYRDFLKRFTDLFFAAILLLLLSPVFIIMAILIKAAVGGRIFFLQERPGKNTRIFKLIKFKTMLEIRDEQGRYLPDDLRLNKAGKSMRSLSLDELPQLLNILKGDMSFVGPRPLLPKYLPLYNTQQLRRHEVRPGLTGWAQINGRNDISWQQKFELDVWYVDHLKLPLDIKIIFMTIKKVLFREGVTKIGFATTEPFNGTN